MLSIFEHRTGSNQSNRLPTTYLVFYIFCMPIIISLFFFDASKIIFANDLVWRIISSILVFIVSSAAGWKMSTIRRKEPFSG